jgi:predicted solute-binding protein
VAFEWWLWQHLPFVFAVWAIRKDAEPGVKKRLELALTKALAMNTQQFDAIAGEYAKQWGMPAEDLQRYLANFVYRLSQPEAEAIAQFKTLVNDPTTCWVSPSDVRTPLKAKRSLSPQSSDRDSDRPPADQQVVG